MRDKVQREITQKILMQELPFLHSAHRLMLIDICMKFREDSFRGFQVTERTRFVTDRQTDRRTSGRLGKNNMSPNPSGGDIKKGNSVMTIDATADMTTNN